MENEHVPTLDELLAHVGGPGSYDRSPRVWFCDPDIGYLWGKTAFDHRFLGRMLGWFGCEVVREALRRSVEDEVNQENIFVGVCRNVENEIKVARSR